MSFLVMMMDSKSTLYIDYVFTLLLRYLAFSRSYFVLCLFYIPFKLSWFCTTFVQQPLATKPAQPKRSTTNNQPQTCLCNQHWSLKKSLWSWITWTWTWRVNFGKMPFYEGIGLIAEKNAVVIDIGSAYTKVCKTIVLHSFAKFPFDRHDFEGWLRGRGHAPHRRRHAARAPCLAEAPRRRRRTVRRPRPVRASDLLSTPPRQSQGPQGRPRRRSPRACEVQRDHLQSPLQAFRGLLAALDWSFAFLLYRASHVLEDLGWVDLDLGSSPGWWAATVATYLPSRVVEHPKP